jgi:hypothetical protein
MGGERLKKPNTKGTNPMKRSYRILTGKVNSKSVAEQGRSKSGSGDIY